MGSRTATPSASRTPSQVVTASRSSTQSGTLSPSAVRHAERVAEPQRHRARGSLCAERLAVRDAQRQRARPPQSQSASLSQTASLDARARRPLRQSPLRLAAPDISRPRPRAAPATGTGQPDADAQRLADAVAQRDELAFRLWHGIGLRFALRFADPSADDESDADAEQLFEP